HQALLRLGASLIELLREIAVADYEASVEDDLIDGSEDLDARIAQRRSEPKEQLGSQVMLIADLLKHLGTNGTLRMDFGRQCSSESAGEFVARWRAVTGFWRKVDSDHVDDTLLEGLPRIEVKPGDGSLANVLTSLVECRNLHAHPNKWGPSAQTQKSIDLGS